MFRFNDSLRPTSAITGPPALLVLQSRSTLAQNPFQLCRSTSTTLSS